MSTGLATEASAGSTARSASWVPSASGSTRSFCGASASAQRIPGPPALVTTATRSPAGSGWRVSNPATSNISPIVSVRISPAWANSASTVVSDAASIAPVCEEAARCPAAVRPLLTAITGLEALTRRAMRPNLRGLPNDSR
jgi:hypothetical protein